MRDSIRTHLHDTSGNRLCNEDGPAVPAPSLLEHNDGVDLLGEFCPAAPGPSSHPSF